MNTVKDAVVVTAAASAIVAGFGWPLLRAWRSRGWPHAQSRVTASHIDDDTSGSTKGGMRRIVRVTYRYRVEEQDYTGSRITFASIRMKHTSWMIAQEQLARFKPGTSLDVRYNPAKPGDAVIDTSMPWTFYFGLGIGVIGVIGGLLPFFIGGLY
jgi:Protein of unknown function (DUF3592)